jgi:16S rRNA (guanine527-N7)-methyltransferase
MRPNSFRNACASLGIELTVDQLEAFQAFEVALYAANEVMNLTRVSQEDAWLRHFVDSLLFQDLIPLAATVLDVGTGPGFPSWPLACARPDLIVVALDSSGKMLGFLRRQQLPNLEVVQARAEEWDRIEQFDIVTGRAVAPLSAQLEISAPFAKVGGSVLLMRTPAEETALTRFPVETLGLGPPKLHSRALPGTDVFRLGATFAKIAKTPRQYPRPWAEIKRKPIG